MNTGNRGKFSERIKKIAYNKNRNVIYKNNSIRRMILIPVMFLDKKIHEEKASSIEETNIKEKTSLNKNVKPFKEINNNKIINYNIQRRINNPVINNNKLNKQSKVILLDNKINKKKNVNVLGALSIKKDTIAKDNNIILSPKNNSKKEITNKKKILYDKELYNKQTDIKNDKLNILIGGITNDISKYLIKNINNLEVIESDLYVLSKFDGNKESLERCREYIIKLKALQNKLNKIKRDFDILKEKIDFDNILEINDRVLLDKLIEFRNSVDNDISLSTTKNYKLLEEYKYLYAKIDKIVQETDKLEVEIINRKDELEQTGINFDDFQKRIYSFDKIDKTTNKMLQKQDKILANLANKVNDISVTKKIETTYKGFGSLLFNSLKLYGLYMLSPFKNSIPGIALATVTTKRTVDNLLATVHREDKIKYIYYTDNYIDMLNSSINDLSELDRMMSSSLSDIRKVKTEFINNFSSYSSQLPKYNSVLRKINQIEKQVINNQIKVRTLSERVKVKKKENEKTLVKVKKLNNS